MKPIPAMTVCLIIAGVVGIVAFEHRLARESATRSASDANTPGDAPGVEFEEHDPDAASKDVIPSAPTRRAAPSSMASEARRDLPHADTARLHEEIRSWGFDGARVPDLDPGLNDRARALVADWRVRQAWWRLAAQLEPPIPATVTRVTLTNGGTLWVERAQPSDRGYELELLGSAIRTHVPRDRVSRLEPVARADYLTATAEEHVRRISELERGTAAQLTLALGLARARGENERYDALHAAWLSAGGPRAALSSLPPPEAAELESALAWLPEGMLAGGASTPSSADKRRESESSREASKLVEVKTIRELSSRLGELQRKLSPRLSSQQREGFIDQLNAWEEWLQRQPESVRENEAARELQKSMQLLRLDLYKTGGF